MLKDDKNSSTVQPHRTSESLHYEIKPNIQLVLPKHTSDAGLAEIVSPVLNQNLLCIFHLCSLMFVCIKTLGPHTSTNTTKEQSGLKLGE